MFLLFISYNSGLMHNKVYKNFNEVYESIEQLILEENISDSLISKKELSHLLSREDDYRFNFSNNTWFHLQHPK